MISRLDKESIRLINGEELPISPYKKKEVRDRYDEYIKRKEE
jgi:hypothetical protein